MKRGKVLNNVRLHRRMLEMTQEELAEQAGVHRQTIIAIEKQKYEPAIGVVMAISKALNEPIEALFYLEDKKET
ncbi:helix-turn-helix transcriptional regulator [Lentibacillus sp. CBA3610]|uniref:helix-turn-helix transcriptional regulator n=1 Tax=Lentibacillus sp. CBA3610 TaxID=2518176 RepID=UPI001595E8CA|nr:helix-turn-helix transcriptional regulator [Lentibacillus sp. CBA3610]QKY70667.1 transcriptional regulator [Lentibacillus sp. CBA3610]